MNRPSSRSAASSASNLLLKSFMSSTDFETSDTEIDENTSEEGEEFAWINNIPEGIQYALNIRNREDGATELSKEIKIKLWLEVLPGVPITQKITKILFSTLNSVSDSNSNSNEVSGQIHRWQMRNFEDLLNLGISLKDLTDEEIELKCEIEELKGHGRRHLMGSIKIFDERKNLRSGLVILVIKNSNSDSKELSSSVSFLSENVDYHCNISDLESELQTRVTQTSDSETESDLEFNDMVQDLRKLEECLYKRRKDEVPDWHIKLLKDRLEILKRDVLDGCEFVVNLIIPEPTYPLKVKQQHQSIPNRGPYDYCLEDVCQAQKESLVKIKHAEVFRRIRLKRKGISTSDLRALNVFLERSYDCIDSIPPDLSNSLWINRQYLSTKFPMLLGTFILSVQWTLDVAERDEAMKTIETWRIPAERERRKELIYVLLIVMTKINNLKDSTIWVNLFKKLFKGLITHDNEIINEDSLYSPIILFIKAKSINIRSSKLSSTQNNSNNIPLVQDMPDLVNYFQNILPSRDYLVYWTMKGYGIEDLFRRDANAAEINEEIGKQERLFEGLNYIFGEIQKMKGNRMQKLESLKKALNDPERGVLKFIGQRPLIPGLRSSRELQSESKDVILSATDSFNYHYHRRISSIVVERTNLFKSTALASLLMFITEDGGHSLSLIFKKGDDLRRDAACLNIFRIIWRIWKEDGMIELFPEALLYGIVPIGREGGIVEFVDSNPISVIIKSGVEGESEECVLSNYLKSLKLDSRTVNTNFMRSCVGYSLLTYILGIGDRHLDNLLLTPAGHIFHIDFSYWFGNDPKPFAPPIKMTKEMVRAIEECGVGASMNRSKTEGWNEFKGLCFTALGILRKRSGLILAAIETELSLLDSSQNNIKDAVNFVKERLGVELSQSETLQRFDKLLEESRSALFPQVIETIHKWAQYWKT